MSGNTVQCRMPTTGNNTTLIGLTPIGTWLRAQEEGNKTQHPTGYKLDANGNKTTTENTEFLTLAVEDTSHALDLSQVSAGVSRKRLRMWCFCVPKQVVE